AGPFVHHAEPPIAPTAAPASRPRRVTLRPSVARSAADSAFGVDVHGVERLARRHEEAVALDPAEAQIGAALRQQDASDHRAIRREDRDAVMPGASAPAAPKIALHIAAEPV